MADIAGDSSHYAFPCYLGWAELFGFGRKSFVLVLESAVAFVAAGCADVASIEFGHPNPRYYRYWEHG